MRLIDITDIPDDQYIDFLRWFSMKNPETTWHTVFIDRLKKEDKKIEVSYVIKKLLADPEGYELLGFYRNAIVCPVTDGMIQVGIGGSYSLEDRFDAEKKLAPGEIFVMVLARESEDGRWLRMDHAPLSSLPLEPAPSFTLVDIQWSLEELAKRAIAKATVEIRRRLGV